jgi:hypothetical protein
VASWVTIDPPTASPGRQSPLNAAAKVLTRQFRRVPDAAKPMF